MGVLACLSTELPWLWLGASWGQAANTNFKTMNSIRFFCATLGLAVAVLGTCVATDVKVELQEKKTWQFENGGIRFSNEFDGARLNGLTQVAPDHYRIEISPEKVPVNNSSWYSFKVSADTPQSITITLDYPYGSHRYPPQISRDGGLSWENTQPQGWVFDRNQKTIDFQLEVGTEPVWVAGQEVVDKAAINQWVGQMEEKPFVTVAVAGQSLLGQPISYMDIGNSDANNYVFILGRQHPPEITGSLGLMAFVECLAGDSALAVEFRKHFQVIVLPLLNPDGVDHGHWRLSMAGVDLNRDWAAFKQPETRAVRDLLTGIAARPNARPFLLLDFHSTLFDIFYTQADEQETFPKNFTADWLAAIQTRMPDYKVRRSGTHSSNNVITSKGWSYETFGIPSITVEYGDYTDRELIQRQATIACEEMMTLLLAKLREENPRR